MRAVEPEKRATTNFNFIAVVDRVANCQRPFGRAGLGRPFTEQTRRAILELLDGGVGGVCFGYSGFGGSGHGGQLLNLVTGLCGNLQLVHLCSHGRRRFR